jgi:hypothetical protein
VYIREELKSDMCRDAGSHKDVAEVSEASPMSSRRTIIEPKSGYSGPKTKGIKKGIRVVHFK